MRITPLMFVYIRTMPIFSKQSCIVSSCGTRRTAKLPAPTESSELDQHYRQQSVVSVPSQIIFAIDPNRLPNRGRAAIGSIFDNEYIGYSTILRRPGFATFYHSSESGFV